MSKPLATIIHLLVVLLLACDNRFTAIKSEQSNHLQFTSAKTSASVDSLFNTFILKFNKDTSFQRNRIKFPLKIKRMNLYNFHDTIIQIDNSSFELIDLQKEKYQSHLSDWVKKIIVAQHDTSAIIEIRGKENGIQVDYLFHWINGNWMLTEINDNST